MSSNLLTAKFPYHFPVFYSALSRSMFLNYLIGLTFLLSVTFIDATPAVAFGMVRANIVHWANRYSDSETGVSSVRFLRTTSDDGEERAGFINNLITALSSSKVTPQQLQNWIKEGVPVDTVFTRLQLAKAGDNLFDNPQFVRWIEYTDELNAKMSKHVSVIPTLTAQYGDDALYEMIKIAKNVPSKRALATKVQTEQMVHWVNLGKDPDDVFHLLKLDKEGDKLFSNPEFTAWVKYVDDFNTKNPEEPASITPTLMNYFSKSNLFKMAAEANSGKGTKDIVTKLETEWLQTWLRNRKSPDKVLIDLGFEKAADTLLGNPLFSTWVKYFDDFNEKYPDKKTTMIEAFTKTFGDAGVTTMLDAAKMKTTTDDIAKKLESDQLKMWLSSEKSADDVFMALNLDKVGNDFIDNPLFKTWMSYTNVFIKENSEKKATVFSTLEDHISDRLLIKILEEAKKYPTMESAATKVQTEKIQSYLASKKSPVEVFKLLGLDDAGVNILSTSLFQPWLEYVKVFNKQNPNQRVFWYDTLRINSSWFILERSIELALANPSTVKIGKMVESARLKDWLGGQKYTPDLVFQFLYLHKKADDTLVSPNFKLWSKYLDDFNKRYPDHKTTMIDVLGEHYGNRALLRMFKMANNDPRSKKIATELQNALINKWLIDQKTPMALKEDLISVETADEMINRYVKELAKVSGNTL